MNIKKYEDKLMSLDFYMPSLAYIKFGNIYSASIKNFNFKIFPNIEQSKFRVVLWLGLKCCEKSDIIAEKNFELSEEGLKIAKSWIIDRYSKKD